MLFVAFFSEEPDSNPKPPLISLTEKLEVLAIRDQTAFILARRKKNGWFGFPNNFIEKQLGGSATTRTWKTVVKIVGFAQKTDANPPRDVLKRVRTSSDGKRLAP